MKIWITSLGTCVGSGLAALCCLGIPAIVGFLSAIGMGFILNDALLMPLLMIFLGLNLWATHASSEQHGRKMLTPLAVVSALLIVSGFWVSGILVGFGILGLFTTSGLNIYFAITCQTTCRTS